MNKILILLYLIFPIIVYGQSENSCQPDSVYINKHVKKIIAFLNSPRDLSEVTYLDREGHKIRSVKYSASYNRKTRKNKDIDMMRHYKYDSNMRLVQIIDSAVYLNNSFGINNTYLHYDSMGTLTKSQYYIGNFKTPNYETFYSYIPYKSTTIQHNDTLIIYHKTKEYENEFYVKRFYGYYLEPKLKDGIIIDGQDTSRYQYSDYNDLQKFNDNMVLKNTYNSKGQIISSDINSVFMNDRTTTYKMTYFYYSNGLLKSVRGYVPEFFEYEFYK